LDIKLTDRSTKEDEQYY